MMMSLFVEHHSFYMDHELLAASAGYVRDSFVMVSLGQVSESEHLERILLDAVCTEPVQYDIDSLNPDQAEQQPKKYRRYQKVAYVPEPHYKREDH